MKHIEELIFEKSYKTEGYLQNEYAPSSNASMAQIYWHFPFSEKNHQRLFLS